MRAVALVVLVAAGVVGAFWVDSLEFDPTGPMSGVGGSLRGFVDSGGLTGALLAVVCLTVTLGSAYLLLARPSARVRGSQRQG